MLKKKKRPVIVKGERCGRCKFVGRPCGGGDLLGDCKTFKETDTQQSAGRVVMKLAALLALKSIPQ